MSLARDLSAAGAFFRLGWRGVANQPLALIGRILLFELILAIFWHIWQATPLEELGRPGYDATGLLWYLAVTEWIVFASGISYRDVEADIREGRVEVALTRPVSYATAILAEWAGATALRLIILGGIGFGSAAAITGIVPIGAIAALAILCGGVLGCAMILLCQFQIGLSAIWFPASAPVFWIWQKFLFVFGGLIMPLALYPAALRSVSEASPFAAMLATPASLVFDASLHAILLMIAGQSIWLVLIAVMSVMTNRLAIARLTAQGA